MREGVGPGLENRLRHLIKKSRHLIHNSQFDCGLGHAVNHATVLVFGQCSRPGGPKGLHAASAIAPHAGQQRCHRLRARVFSGGTEQHVHRGTAVMHRRSMR